MRLSLCLFLLLMGCAQQPVGPSYQERVHARCASYGFTPGTDQFRDCVMKVDMAVRQAVIQQELQDQSAAQVRAMPLCSSLTAFEAGFYRAQGRCR